MTKQLEEWIKIQKKKHLNFSWYITKCQLLSEVQTVLFYHMQMNNNKCRSPQAANFFCLFVCFFYMAKLLMFCASLMAIYLPILYCPCQIGKLLIFCTSLMAIYLPILCFCKLIIFRTSLMSIYLPILC